MRNDAKERLRRLEDDAKEMSARLRIFSPGSADYVRLDERLAAVKREMERDRKANRDLELGHARETAGILEEIRDVIAAVAKARGLDYVIKAEARPLRQTDADPSQVLAAMNRSVLYANPRNDITEEVIRELNRPFEAAGDKATR